MCVLCEQMCDELRVLSLTDSTMVDHLGYLTVWQARVCFAMSSRDKEGCTE